MKQGGIKEYIFLIAGVVYVLAMFPLFYLFHENPANTFSAFPQNILLISEGGCFLLMGQFLVGALYAPGKKKQA
jgi:hypothetical protein